MSGWLIRVESASLEFDVFVQGHRDHDGAIQEVIGLVPAGFRPIGWIRVRAGEAGPYHDRKS